MALSFLSFPSLPSLQRSAPPLFDARVSVARAGEAVATVRARCTPCDWGAAGHEGAAVVVSIDDRYSQHIVLFRGEPPAEYRVALGRLEAGDHRLLIARDEAWTPVGVSVRVDDARVETPPLPLDQLALAHAPVLHLRPDTINRFTDIALLSWYEVEKAGTATRLRYGVIFSNEDGGTPTDRLMATWGRTTDIEYVYWTEVDADGEPQSGGFEGPGHQMRTFAGRREERHPLLWVATQNNMVDDRGDTAIRVRPAPVRFDLADVSREAVMDAQPWTYEVSAKEIAREGKMRADAPAGSGAIPDPRLFVYVEACGDLTSAAVAFSVTDSTGDRDAHWWTSDRGVPEFRIARNGCFRGAIPLPPTLDPRTLRRFRVTAFPRSSAKDAAPPSSFQARLTRINKVFMLDERHTPGDSRLSWIGTAILTGDMPNWTTSLK